MVAQEHDRDRFVLAEERFECGSDRLEVGCDGLDVGDDDRGLDPGDEQRGNFGVGGGDHGVARCLEHQAEGTSLKVVGVCDQRTALALTQHRLEVGHRAAS